jgi:UDP-2-acetamido-3-amino-2,3-dideoxy-glucuronate N-acetyltransferase
MSGALPIPPSVYIDPTAVVDDGAVIGPETKVWHFTHLLAGARVGDHCVLGQNVMVGGKARIGDRVKVQNNVSVYDGVTLEDDVFVGPSAVFTNVFNPRASINRKDEYRPTLIGKGATIGANATIVCGVEIGAYAFIGAGAVVTRDVPAHGLITGVPGRLTGWMCKCGERFESLEEALGCEACRESREP